MGTRRCACSTRHGPWAAEKVGGALRSLARDDGRQPVDLCLRFLDEELAAVTAYTTARAIYLRHALRW